jgi:hypothetical protein
MAAGEDDAGSDGVALLIDGGIGSTAKQNASQSIVAAHTFMLVFKGCMVHEWHKRQRLQLPCFLDILSPLLP